MQGSMKMLLAAVMVCMMVLARCGTGLQQRPGRWAFAGLAWASGRQFSNPENDQWPVAAPAPALLPPPACRHLAAGGAHHLHAQLPVRPCRCLFQ